MKPSSIFYNNPRVYGALSVSSSVVAIRMTSAPTLEVTTEPPSYLPALRVDGVPLRAFAGARPKADVNKLIAATARLRLFRELRAAIGTAAWPNIHRALCAGLQPRVAADGELLFSGLHTLKSPLLVLHGEATLLAMPRPDVPPEEAAALRPGDCLAAASLTWLQPLTTTAVARGRVQLLALPPDVYHEHCKLPHLQLLQQRALLLGRLPLLRGCGDTALRALAYSAERRARPPRAALLREGTPCTGLAVLASGSASVTVQLPKVGAGAAGGGRSKVDAMLAALLPRAGARSPGGHGDVYPPGHPLAGSRRGSTVAASRRESLVPRAAGIGRWEKPATLDERTVEAPVADGAPELDPLRRALQAMEEAEMTPKEKRASLRQRGVGT